MICCKIIADFNLPTGKFAEFLGELSLKGDFLWENNILYFGDTFGETNYKSIEKLLKKTGYPKYFIYEYGKDNSPQETERINGWLLDKIVRINYMQYERTSQEVFHNISKGLDMLEEEINVLKNKEVQKLDANNQKGEKQTEV